MLSHDGVGAEIFAFTRFAVSAYPHVIKLRHGMFNDNGVIGEDARLEVALIGGFHTDSSPCEVGAADIYLFTVKYHHLEMDSRT